MSLSGDDGYNSFRSSKFVPVRSCSTGSIDMMYIRAIYIFSFSFSLSSSFFLSFLWLERQENFVASCFVFCFAQTAEKNNQANKNALCNLCKVLSIFISYWYTVQLLYCIQYSCCTVL